MEIIFMFDSLITVHSAPLDSRINAKFYSGGAGPGRAGLTGTEYYRPAAGVPRR